MQHDRDIDEFLSLVEAHQGIVHKVSFVYGQSFADREDLAQEILLQLWKSFESFDGRSGFSTWMYRVALNTAITFKRKLKPPLPDREEAWELGEQLEQAELSDDLRTLYRAIARLSAVEKAIIMQWLDERSYQEIADTMGMSVANVSVRLVRIRARLAQLINRTEQQ